MFSNRYTIFISPPKAGKSRQLFLHKSVLYGAVLLFLVFIVGNGVGLYKYYENVKLQKENSRLKEENKKLEGLTQIVEEIEKDESFIRDFLGLENTGSSMGGLGQGGISRPFTSTSFNYPLEVGSSLIPQLSEGGHSPVEKALVLKKNLEGIIDDLMDRKSEWDRKPTILPVDTDEYWFSSGYGWRKSPFTGRREFHSGLDISSRRGTPIIAPADGKVISVGKDRYLGKFLKIAHSDNLTTIYGHLMEHKVKKGKPVKRGDVIGLMGNTGLSTGHHLHYQVQKDNKSVNPKQYILNTRTSQTVLAQR
jgi:murein DD-endopeptidase MepM/ murein hydrolase activator NlpD